MDVPSIRKNRYFCILVDDETCYLWFLGCAKKSDFTEWFTHLDTLFTNHYGTHTKILCMDHGGEYVNNTLESYCAENGIVLELTVPHTLEQNGVTERSNRRILDKGHTLLKDTSAPNFLWAHALVTAMYAINRAVSSTAGGVTPFEVFFGWRPDISHMRVWFSDVFAHCLKDLGAKKLGEQGHCVKFLGYLQNSSGYM